MYNSTLPSTVANRTGTLNALCRETNTPTVNTHVNSPLLRYSQFADKPPRSHKANAAANTLPPVVDAGSALELASLP